MEQNQKIQNLLIQVIALEEADMGNVQIFHPKSNDLRIVAQSGFSADFLRHFISVKPFDPSTCGRAFGIGSTVLINDIGSDIGYQVNKGAAIKAGYRAVKSVPIFGTDYKCIGVISTHFAKPKWSWETHGAVTLLPQLAAELEGMLQTV